MMTMTSWPVPNTGPMLVPSGPRHRVPSWTDRLAAQVLTSAMLGGLLAFGAYLVVTL